MIEELKDDSIMPWGTHAGMLMSSIPVTYFNWIWHSGLKNDKVAPVATYIRRNVKKFKETNKDLVW